MYVVTFCLVRGVALRNCCSWAERSESLEDEPLLLPLGSPQDDRGI